MPIINVEDFAAINKVTIDRRKENIKFKLQAGTPLVYRDRLVREVGMRVCVCVRVRVHVHVCVCVSICLP